VFGTESPEKARHRLIESGRLLKRQSEKQGTLKRRKDHSRRDTRLDAIPQRAIRAAVAQDTLDPAEVQAEELPHTRLNLLR
jgi:hypothetical protein